jgi:hypothetical protein
MSFFKYFTLPDYGFLKKSKHVAIYYKGKGKGHPITGHEGTEIEL